MTIKVLVVDDSGFFRRRIQRMLEEDPAIEVVGTAADGKEAVDLVARLRPDVVTLDIEMPVMDGITALERIMAEHPTPVLMFSSLTYDGAHATLRALEKGAVDYLPKKFEEISRDRKEAKRQLCEKVKAVARSRALGGRVARTAPAPPHPEPASPPRPVAPATPPGHVEVVAIGASTGGPQALQVVLKAIPANFPHPIVIFQHMPANFTGPFAERLDRVVPLSVHEARDGEMLEGGKVYLAPGGRQMLVRKNGAGRVQVVDAVPTDTYKPSVDKGFAALAESFGGHVLACILTGMGADGREGARALKARGAQVWAQDEATSTIYGMPAAVAQAGLADRILPLDQIGVELARLGR